MVTYALLHSLEDTGHLLFNGLAFYFFAPELEELWGRTRFVLFMVLSALGGAAFFLVAWAIGLSSAQSVVGFSGVVMAVMTAWGLTYPDREMFFFFFRLKGLHLVYVTVALQLLTALSFSNVSASAHFGGMAAGAAFAPDPARPPAPLVGERAPPGAASTARVAAGGDGRAARPRGPAGHQGRRWRRPAQARQALPELRPGRRLRPLVAHGHISWRTC